MLLDHGNTVLCDLCRNIDVDHLLERPIQDTHDLEFLGSLNGFFEWNRIHKHPHHNSFKDLNDCADSGRCSLCKVICDRVRHVLAQQNASITDVPQLNTPDTPISFALRRGSTTRSVKANGGCGSSGDDEGSDCEASDDESYKNMYWTGIEVFIREVGIPQHSILCRLRVYSGLNDTSSTRLSSGRPVFYDPYSTPLISVINEWLQACQQKHTACSAHGTSPSDSSFMPTRVIHVGVKDSKGIFADPHLVLGEVSPGPWIALSHTWGGDESCCLMKGNLRSRMERIALSELPKSFRHAVIVTRELGIAYLWIDSLCIIQDDAQDWNKEAAAMSLVYSSSVLTLAATSSRSSKGGIFKQSAGVNDAIPVIAKTAKYGKCTISIQNGLLDWLDAIESEAYSPLASRAWVLQEQVLSPRTVHFAEDQVFWECRESRIGQATGVVPPVQARDWDDGEDAVGLYRLWEMNKILVLPLVENDLRASVLNYRSATHAHHMSWQALVESYSCRKLTKGQDILRAISGLALAFQARLSGAKYLAGLWDSFLPEGLAWRRVEANSKREANYQQTPGQMICKPSWSWISVPHQICFYQPFKDQDPRSHYRAQTVHAETYLEVPTDHFSDVVGASLRIRGLSTFIKINGDPKYQGSQAISLFVLPVPTGEDDDPKEAHLQVRIPTSSQSYETHLEPIFPLQADGSLLYEKTNYEDDGDPTGFICYLDTPHEKDRSTPGTWLSFHLLRVYDHTYLMLKENNNNSKKFHRIGLAVLIWLWGEKPWSETVREFDII